MGIIQPEVVFFVLWITLLCSEPPPNHILPRCKIYYCSNFSDTVMHQRRKLKPKCNIYKNMTIDHRLLLQSTMCTPSPSKDDTKYADEFLNELPLAMLRRNGCSSYSIDDTDRLCILFQVVQLCYEHLLPRNPSSRS